MGRRTGVTATEALRLDICSNGIGVHDLALIPNVLGTQRAALERLPAHLIMEVTRSARVVVLNDALLWVTPWLDGLNRPVALGGHA